MFLPQPNLEFIIHNIPPTVFLSTINKEPAEQTAIPKTIPPTDHIMNKVRLKGLLKKFVAGGRGSVRAIQVLGFGRREARLEERQQRPTRVSTLSLHKHFLPMHTRHEEVGLRQGTGRRRCSILHSAAELARGGAKGAGKIA